MNGTVGQGGVQQGERRNGHTDRFGELSTAVPEEGGDGVRDGLRPVVQMLEAVVVQGLERIAKHQERM